MRQCRGPGRSTVQVGQLRIASRKWNACSVVEGGSKMRALVTIRTRPCSTSSESANRLRSGGAFGEPGRVSRMITRILPVSVNQDVHIGHQHDDQRILPRRKFSSSSIVSRSEVRSKSSSGSTNFPLTVKSLKGGAVEPSSRARWRRKASSTSTLRVAPCAAAYCFAFSSSGSGSEIVVLMNSV